jgi:cardiolipin synthase
MIVGLGTWRSLVSALVWGTRGRRFKSGRPDYAAGKVSPARRGGRIVAESQARALTFSEAKGSGAADMSGPSTSADPAGAERRIATVPNLLSGLRLASVPVFVWLFVSGKEEAAVILYGVGASTDWVDGYVARRTGAVTELGRLLDPLADRAFIVALAVALLIRGTLPPWLGAVIVVRDVAVLALWPVVDRRHARRMRVNFIGKSATAALLVGLTWLAVSETRWWWVGVADEIGLVFTAVGAVLYWVSGVMYALEAVRGGRGVEGK